MALRRPPLYMLLAPNCCARPLLLLLSCGSVMAQAPAPPHPGNIPANASRVTATVLAERVWPPGSLANTRPAVAPDLTLHSLTVRIGSSEFVAPEVDHLAVAGRTLEIFSLRPLPKISAGQKINATIRLVGDAEASRWMVKELSPIP